MGGNVTLSANGTYVIGYEYQREIGGPFIQNTGRFIDTGVIFRWKHSLQATYARPGWSLGLAQRYQRGYGDENKVAAAFSNRVASYQVFDLFASFTPIKLLSFNVGVRNLLDQDPPFSNQGQTFQKAYDPRYTDPTGRAFFVRANLTLR